MAWAQDRDFLDELNRPVAQLLAGAKSTPDAQHTPRLRVPRVVEMATEVLVTVEVPLVGDDKHYIRRVALIDENSLVQVKYIATFSPQVRSVRITAPIKMAKTSRLKAVVECPLHGKWLGVSETIQVGAGGCAAGQEPSRKLIGNVVQLRFQQSGAGIETSLLFRHPMISGYTLTRDNRIVKSYDPFYLKSSRLYKGQVLAEFELGPGLSENPRISILLPRLGAEPLQAEAVNSDQQKFSLLARMP
jgi:desulfoferrodoxin (superoxide reductase-like protein)